MAGFVEMRVDEMKEFTPNTPELLRALEIDAETTAAKLVTIGETAREQFYYALVREIVETRYDIGKLLEVYQIFGGYVNTTFGIYTEKDGEKQTWLVRKYRDGKTIDSLLFEHRLLIHAREHGFSFCANPIQTTSGKTYCTEMVETGEGLAESVFAIFDYIGGDRKYDWIPNWAEDDFAEATLLSAARNMAELHSSTFDFDPQGLHGDNIMDNEDSPCNTLIGKYGQTMKGYREIYAENGLDNPYIEFFDATYDYVTNLSIKHTISEEDYAQMLICPCHCDFHGGNFKYYEDGNISGSFDYDMAKVDSRLFDIGLAMHYVFASWKLATNGVMRLDRVERFVRAYDSECAAIGKIPPLSALEKNHLYDVLIQGPIYVHGWCTADVMRTPTVDPFEYLYYMQHFIESLRWLEAHEEEVKALIARL